MIQVKIKHSRTIPITIIPSKKSPEIFIPLEISTNLKIKLIKSVKDKNPNIIDDFLTVIKFANYWFGFAFSTKSIT